MPDPEPIYLVTIRAVDRAEQVRRRLDSFQKATRYNIEIMARSREALQRSYDLLETTRHLLSTRN